MPLSLCTKAKTTSSLPHIRLQHRSSYCGAANTPRHVRGETTSPALPSFPSPNFRFPGFTKRNRKLVVRRSCPPPLSPAPLFPVFVSFRLTMRKQTRSLRQPVGMCMKGGEGVGGSGGNRLLRLSPEPSMPRAKRAARCRSGIMHISIGCPGFGVCRVGGIASPRSSRQGA